MGFVFYFLNIYIIFNLKGRVRDLPSTGLLPKLPAAPRVGGQHAARNQILHPGLPQG